MMRRVAIGAVGLAAMGYGLVGAVGDPSVRPVGQALSLLGAVLLHDLVFAPLALAVGVVVARYAPPALRAPLQAALVASAAVTLVALPFVGGFGRAADMPSALPLNYTRGWLLMLAAIWLTAAIAIAVRISRATTRSAADD